MHVAALPKVDVIRRPMCWCGSTCEPQFRTRTFGLVRCSACGCYRIDPPPIDKDDEAAAFYTNYYGRPADVFGARPTALRSSRFWHVVRAEASLERVGQRVADIGCGEGHLCAELQRAGWPEVIGVDVSRARIERARGLYPDVTFYDRPLDRTNEPQQSFDLIIMDNVIEHLPDPVNVLRSLRRYLKRDGRLAIITPNMTCGHFKLLGRRWTPELAPHAHIYLFTPASMGLLLRESGFSADAIGDFHLAIYSPWAFLRRLLSSDAKGALWRAGQELSVDSTGGSSARGRCSLP